MLDIDLSEESGLTDGDRHGHIAGKRGAADRGKTECRRENYIEPEKTRLPRHVDLLLTRRGP